MKPRTSKEFKVFGRLLQAIPKLLSNTDHVSLHGAFLVESSIRLWVSWILWLPRSAWKPQGISGWLLISDLMHEAHCKGQSPDTRLAASTWEYVTPYSRGKVAEIWRGVRTGPRSKSGRAGGVNAGSNSKYDLSVIGIYDPDDTLKCFDEKMAPHKMLPIRWWHSQNDSRHGRDRTSKRRPKRLKGIRQVRKMIVLKWYGPNRSGIY